MTISNESRLMEISQAIAFALRCGSLRLTPDQQKTLHHDALVELRSEPNPNDSQTVQRVANRIVKRFSRRKRTQSLAEFGDDIEDKKSHDRTARVSLLDQVDHLTREYGKISLDGEKYHTVGALIALMGNAADYFPTTASKEATMISEKIESGALKRNSVSKSVRRMLKRFGLFFIPLAGIIGLVLYCMPVRESVSNHQLAQMNSSKPEFIKGLRIREN